MTKPRTPPAWRAAFLRALARTGSIAAAARECGIDRTSAYQLRKRNPAFAASWERAQAAAREVLSPRPSSACEAGAQDKLPAEQAGGDLMQAGATPAETPACPEGSSSRAAGLPASRGAGDRARPILRPNETIRSSRTGKTCIIRTGPDRWSAAKEAVFLAELTASANVKAAARAAGVSAVAVYNRRKLWPAFKAQWDAAVAEGSARLETLVICAATTTLDPEPLPQRDHEAERMSMDQALKVWLALNARTHGDRKRRLGGPPRREPDIEEVRAEIMRKVAAIKRARGIAG